MNKHQRISVAIVIVTGIVLGGLILTWDKAASPDTLPNAHDETAPAADARGNHKTIDSSAAGKETGQEPGKGPRGGKLFIKDGFGVEVTIFEKGVPPQLRLYLYENRKPLPPTAAKVTVTLSRLGAPAQIFNFKPEAGYLLGDQVVEEPHSFDMAIAVDHNDELLRWGYSQVEARVAMPDEMLKSSGIEIRTAGPATLRLTLKLPGEIIFDEHTIVGVVPRLPGIVDAVYRHHGQHVQKGEVLAVIESMMLADLRSQLFAARKRLGLARITYEREKQLWKEKISAKQDYLAAQQALAEAEITSDLALSKLRTLGVRPEAIYQEHDLSRYEIQAPIPGLITDKAIAQGQTLKEDTAIFTIADVSTVWAQITVYAKDLDVLKIGQKAKVKATAIDVEGKGEIFYISALVGAATRTATARIILDNKDGRWRPGMFVTAELVAEEIQAPVAVSVDAIQTLNDWSVVFGRYGKHFEARPLKLGRSDGKMVEVLGGLSVGEQYAAGNSFIIKSELGKAGATHDH